MEAKTSAIAGPSFSHPRFIAKIIEPFLRELECAAFCCALVVSAKRSADLLQDNQLPSSQEAACLHYQLAAKTQATGASASPAKFFDVGPSDIRGSSATFASRVW